MANLHIGAQYGADIGAIQGSEAPTAVAHMGGTATNFIIDTDIVNGSKTIFGKLVGDTWVAAGVTFDAVRQPLIDGLNAASSPANGWNNEVRDKLPVTAVERISDEIIRITLNAQSGYSIVAQEEITWTIPAAAMVLTASPVIASSTFTIDTATTITAVTSAITAVGGTAHDGERFSVDYPAGGLLGAVGASIAGVVCTKVAILSDTSAEATAPSDNVNHSATKTLAFTGTAVNITNVTYAPPTGFSYVDKDDLYPTNSVLHIDDGTATGGSTTTATTTKNYTLDQFVGRTFRNTGRSPAQESTITGVTAGPNSTITFSPALPATVNNGHSFQIIIPCDENDQIQYENTANMVSEEYDFDIAIVNAASDDSHETPETITVTGNTGVPDGAGTIVMDSEGVPVFTLSPVGDMGSFSKTFSCPFTSAFTK